MELVGGFTIPCFLPDGVDEHVYLKDRSLMTSADREGSLHGMLTKTFIIIILSPHCVTEVVPLSNEAAWTPKTKPVPGDPIKTFTCAAHLTYGSSYW